MKKWKFVGGNLAVDFVNSIGGRNEKGVDNYTIRDDKFNSYEDLIDWAKETGILTKPASIKIITAYSKKPNETKKFFTRAKLLRESIYRIFRHSVEGLKPFVEDLEILNNEFIAAEMNQKLIFSSNMYKRSFTADERIDIILWKVALSAAELLVWKDLSRLKRCPGEDCGWLFYDTSKNRSRQWCDMKDCGNFEKVRRFRERKK